MRYVGAGSLIAAGASGAVILRGGGPLAWIVLITALAVAQVAVLMIAVAHALAPVYRRGYADGESAHRPELRLVAGGMQ